MTADEILAFCFPPDMARDLERHLAWWGWMMRGGADTEIIKCFAELPDRLAAGELADWTTSARNRLAAILALDQFPRSIFRESSRAYAFDPIALELTREGLACGHFSMLEHPWERTMFAMPLVHAEGPNLRARAAVNVQLAKETLSMAPDELKPAYEFCLAQSRRHKVIIDRFGRHPHRNKTLRRPSAPGEQVYITNGEFPHQHAINPRKPKPFRST
jgi:uncharacterized protein (DUF924 family)